MKYISCNLAMAAMLLCMDSNAAAISGQGSWESTLQARDLDGNAATIEAYYDTDLGITWLADTQYTKTTAYVDPTNFYVTPGYLSWNGAVQWAANISIHGFDGWRLPLMVDPGTPGCDPTVCGYEGVNLGTSELAHMFYVTLGNQANPRVDGAVPGEINTGNFQKLGSWYWFGNEFRSDPRAAWYFEFASPGGVQSAMLKGTGISAWLVHPGDIGSPVPEPATSAMMIAGFAGFLALRLKQCAA